MAHVAKFGFYTFKVGHFDSPWGITFRIGEIESVVALLMSFVTTMVTWYSRTSLEIEVKENKLPLYYTLLLLLEASLLGIVYTYDMFNAFVFIEVSTLTACGLIVAKDYKENIKAALKYLILSSLGSGLVLFGIAFLYSMTGHLNMGEIHKVLVNNYSVDNKTILISLTLFTIGLGIKGAMFPLHIWLPDAHSSAPSISSSILSGIVIKAPIVLMFKVLFIVYGLEFSSNTMILNLLLTFGAIGMIMGSLFAKAQTDIKRLVAYSSVAQMGYIYFAFGLGNELGIAIAIYHIVAHGLTKSALFLAVGSIIEQTGIRDINKLRGIGKEMPVTLAIFTLGALSMVGIPILPGFISKWNLALATIESDKLMLLLVILASSLLNAVYYFPIIVNGYFGVNNKEGKVYMSKSKPIKELMPLICLSIAMVLVGFLSGPILNVITNGVRDALM
jgi:multicomponent Na+:H+ antiporter subunit D